MEWGGSWVGEDRKHLLLAHVNITESECRACFAYITPVYSSLFPPTWPYSHDYARILIATQTQSYANTLVRRLWSIYDWHHSLLLVIRFIATIRPHLPTQAGRGRGRRRKRRSRRRKERKIPPSSAPRDSLWCYMYDERTRQDTVLNLPGRLGQRVSPAINVNVCRGLRKPLCARRKTRWRCLSLPITSLNVNIVQSLTWRLDY